MNFELSGIITKINDVESLYETHNPFKFFKKQKIELFMDGNYYLIEFHEKNFGLIESIRMDQEVVINTELKGFRWFNNNRYYNINSLIGKSLKILRNSSYDKKPIEFLGTKFYLKKFYEDKKLMLKLVDINSTDEIIITNPNEYPNKKFNEDHIHIDEIFYKEIYPQLYKNGIIDKGVYIGNVEKEFFGYTCKVLVLDLFNHDCILDYELSSEILFSHKLNKHKDYTSSDFIDETDWSHYNDDLDMDQQSDEFWNQF